MKLATKINKPNNGPSDIVANIVNNKHIILVANIIVINSGANGQNRTDKGFYPIPVYKTGPIAFPVTLASLLFTPALIESMLYHRLYLPWRNNERIKTDPQI